LVSCIDAGDDDFDELHPKLPGRDLFQRGFRTSKVETRPHEKVEEEQKEGEQEEEKEEAKSVIVVISESLPEVYTVESSPPEISSVVSKTPSNPGTQYSDLTTSDQDTTVLD